MFPLQLTFRPRIFREYVMPKPKKAKRKKPGRKPKKWDEYIRS